MTTEHTASHERLDRMFRMYADSVYRFARQRVPPEDADDIVCEVFAVAWRRLPEVPEAELGWLLGTARKKVAEYLRARRRRGSLSERVTSFSSRDSTDHARDVVDSAEIDWVLGQLPDRDQEVLRLLLVQDLSVSEIAAALGCRPNTASVRIRRARERLVAVYAGRGDASPHEPAGIADAAPPERPPSGVDASSADPCNLTDTTSSPTIADSADFEPLTNWS